MPFNTPKKSMRIYFRSEYGNGKRRNSLSDYTFAVWDGDALVPFAKAYSGLTDAELRQLEVLAELQPSVGVRQRERAGDHRGERQGVSREEEREQPNREEDDDSGAEGSRH